MLDNQTSLASRVLASQTMGGREGRREGGKEGGREGEVGGA